MTLNMESPTTKICRRASAPRQFLAAACAFALLKACESGTHKACTTQRLLRAHRVGLRLRGGVSKYYNHTAPPRRAGIFEELGGLPPVSHSLPRTSSSRMGGRCELSCRELCISSWHAHSTYACAACDVWSHHSNRLHFAA